MSQPTYPFSPSQRTPGSADLRREADAAVQARRELGPDYDDAVAAGLADKVEQLVAYRTAELRAQSDRQLAESGDERLRRNQRFALGIVSLGAGVPITAIAALNVDPGALGVLIGWAGIVGVNVAAAWNGRRRPT
ncbi:hypothetical protein [Microlunatus ginsengisoli]|uniref:DUF1707 domain-containing protein n=1 Tax=Microlunatus ginsengisoli TaxID=363863 RepID=A0ABP7AUS1_9ACTN